MGEGGAVDYVGPLMEVEHRMTLYDLSQSLRWLLWLLYRKQSLVEKHGSGDIPVVIQVSDG